MRTDVENTVSTQAGGFSSNAESDSKSDPPMLRSKSLDIEIIYSIDNESSREDNDGSSDSNADSNHSDARSTEEDDNPGKLGRIRWSKSENDQLGNA